MRFFLIFLLVPIIEIALFIKVGGAIGLWPTLALVLLAAFGGAALMRLQGMQTLQRLRSSLAAGGDPVGPLAHGALTLVAGMLLLIPGFFTDAVGLLLLVPAVRALLIRWGATRLTVQAASFVQTRRASPGRDAPIEADYEIVEDEAPRRRPGRSGWTRQP